MGVTALLQVTFLLIPSPTLLSTYKFLFCFLSLFPFLFPPSAPSSLGLLQEAHGYCVIIKTKEGPESHLRRANSFSSQVPPPPATFCLPEVQVVQLCLTLCDPMDCSPLGSSVHEILRARILEWVAIPFSRDPPDPGTKPRSPALRADSLPSEPLGKPQFAWGRTKLTYSLAIKIWTLRLLWGAQSIQPLCGAPAWLQPIYRRKNELSAWKGRPSLLLLLTTEQQKARI